MARTTSTILQAGTAYAQDTENVMVDPSIGGQNGFSSDYTTLLNNQPYVSRNLIAIVVEAPKGFQYLDTPNKWVATYRALFEVLPTRISGLDQSLEVETQESGPVGGTENHDEFTNVSRRRSKPVLTIPEKYGMPLMKFYTGYVRNLMADEDSKVASIFTNSGSVPTDQLADLYTGTVAFFEPDRTMSKVAKAWLCTNMMPSGSIEITGRTEKGAAGEFLSHDLTFTATTQVGEGVNQFCQSLLDSMAITNANPYTRAAFLSAISADIAATTSGYANGISTLASSSVRL